MREEEVIEIFEKYVRNKGLSGLPRLLQGAMTDNLKIKRQVIARSNNNFKRRSNP